MHVDMNPVEGVKATICTINSHVTRLQQQLCGIRHLYFSLFFPPTNILLTLMTQNIMDSSSKPFLCTIPSSSVSKLQILLSAFFFYLHVFIVSASGVKKINK